MAKRPTKKPDQQIVTKVLPMELRIGDRLTNE